MLYGLRARAFATFGDTDRAARERAGGTVEVQQHPVHLIGCRVQPQRLFPRFAGTVKVTGEGEGP
jgi:hypothetical protein